MEKKKLTPFEKRDLLRQLIEKYVFLGYDIKPLIGYPLSYYDWDQVKKQLDKISIEADEI